MIGHEQAREWLSARADGELEAALVGAVEEHLEPCDECRRFDAGLARLGVLARALPEATVPVPLQQRIERRARPRWAPRVIPAFAAALAIAVVIVMMQPAARFELPRAAASEYLLTLRSLYVERIVEVRAPDGRVLQSTREKTWWRAPGDMREERTTTQDGVRSKEVTISRATDVYSRGPGGPGTLTRGSPFHLRPLPEPLSPSILLLGERTGGGPRIAGRETDRYVLQIGTERRIAYVDRQRLSTLGGDEHVVLGKGSIGSEGGVRKRVVRIDYNPVLRDSLFAVPADFRDIARYPFQELPVEELAARPAVLPEDFTLVIAGHDDAEDVDQIIYARGAFRIRIDVRATPFGPGPPERRDAVQIGGRAGTLVVSLYEPPRLEFQVGELHIAVVAPLPADALIELASTMFPE